MTPSLSIPGFLDPATTASLAAEVRSAAGSAAPVYGMAPAGAVAPNVRSVLRIDVSAETSARIAQSFEEVRPRLAQHFGTALGAFEEPQFLRYREGDFFVAHQDGNVPLIYDDSRFRRISVVVFLNERGSAADQFTGGSLVLHGHYSAEPQPTDVTGAPGTLVAFPSETTHEVTPVASGERLTIVTWFRSA